MGNGQQSKQTQKLLFLFFAEGLAAFIALLIIPSDQRDAVLFGYSFERGVLMAGILFITVFFLICSLFKKIHESTFIGQVFSSQWICLLSVLTLIAIVGFVIVYKNNGAILLRLSPILLYAGIMSVEIIHYQRKTIDNLISICNDTAGWLKQKNILQGIAIAASAVLLFTNAFTHPEPLSFAGLYTLMAEEIAGANFHLPLQVDLYIPGGLPFAYPPLGLYFMAVFLKAGGSAWTYLRFAPPIFSLIAIIVLYLLVRRMTKSELAGVCAMLLAAGSQPLFYMQAESGGIVRGLACGLGLLSVYFYNRMIEKFNWRYAISAGLFFGLTALTHLGYAYYFAFWITAWIITHPQKRNWSGLGGMVIISLLTALPWLIVIVERYGFSVLTSAFQSHSTINFLTFIQNPVNILTTVRSNLQGLIDQPWLLGLVLCSLVLLLRQKKFTLPMLFTLLVLLNFQGTRFVLIVSFITIGCGIAGLFEIIATIRKEKTRARVQLTAIVSITALLILNFILSYHSLSLEQPLLDQDMMDAAAFLENNTPTDASFLPLFPQDDQSEEWLPYLSQRGIAYPRWGSEWMGNIDDQAAGEEMLRDCMQRQSLVCLENWFIETDTQTDYLILTNDLETLAGELQQSEDWSNVYSNESYAIWVHE